MRFIDEVKINIAAGNGGDGRVGFRREKHVEFGGPDGGDGGDGGSIFFEACTGMSTLVTFRGKKNFKAEPGLQGGGRQCNGRFGEDLILKVPVGTIVRDADNGEIIADLAVPGQKELIAEGGQGGLGNINFKTSTNQAPRKAGQGKAGQVFDLELELRLIADIALIGMPNAGKSTLISVVSSAKPKIADYPFTTLEPNLGVVHMGEDTSYVVADIPGLIEDAAEGKGLGHKFLKHIERTKAFVHLVDVSWCLDEYEAYEQYTTIRSELQKYNPELLNKREVVCLTKTDAMTDEETTKFTTFFEKELDRKVVPLSSVSGDNVELVKSLMYSAIE